MSNEQMVEKIRNGSGDRQELLGLLYEGNRGIIYKTVKPYIDSGMEEPDAMQEAFLGLLEAVERFDPDRGSFISCLCLWVRSVVGRWHTNTQDAKRIPVHMVERIRKYQRICQEYRTQTGQEPEDKILRVALRISQEQLEDVRRFLRERDPVSLSDPVPGFEDVTIGDAIPDPLADPEQEAIDAVDDERDAVRIWEAVDTLPDDQPEIIRLRYEQRQSMRQAGERLGCTHDRIRREEDKALRKLKHNKTIRQIGKSRGYGSIVYHGGLSRFMVSGSSIVEEVILRRLEPDNQIMR